MKIPRWLLACAVFLALARFAAAGDLYSIRDVDNSPLEDLKLDLTQADVFRFEGGRLVFRLAFATPPDIERVRILLDVDGPARGEKGSGADYMIEGASFYRYPNGATDWTWDSIEPPFLVVEGRTITYVLPEISGLGTVTAGRWVAETTFPDLKVADRVPNAGALGFDFRDLPAFPLDPRLIPEDLSEFVAGAPASLCFRYDTELKSHLWKESPAGGNPMAWTPAFASAPLPLRVVLTDAVTHESVALAPEKTFAASNSVKWTGESLGIEWAVMMEPLEDGAVRLTGQLQSPAERCVRIGIGCGLALDGWTWHDDFRFRREISGSNEYANTVPCAFGGGGRSPYPFGVISSDKGTLVAETDIGEPRIYTIMADAGTSFFGICYDFGITPLTSNFPGRVAFSCALRSSGRGRGDSFREALASFYARQPDVANRTVADVGSVLPFADPGSIPNIRDFGFAFSERLRGDDFDAAAGRGILNFGYSEPWLYWLPIQADVKRTDDEAVRRMTVLATGGDRRAELAGSALLGGARQQDRSVDFRFEDVPWNSGARAEVNTDAELAIASNLPLNRAMSEWREVKRILADSRMSGIFLDSMAEARAADYNPRAMAVADYPCTYEAGALKPCLPMEWSEFEYVGALSRAMKARGKFIMGNSACADSPFFMKYVDVPVEEMELFNTRLANYHRVMSGRKPFTVLLNTAFGGMSAPVVSTYFKACLFLGFLPGFFSEDGFNNPYWNNSTWFERDRPLFKSYMPLARRLAAGGWMPVGFASCADDSLWLESFGDVVPGLRHVTVRNSGAAPARTELKLPAAAEPCIVIDPLSAESFVIESNGTACPLMISGGEIELRDVVPSSVLDPELAFVRGWNSGNGEGAACVKVLESIRLEMRLGAICNVSYPSHAALGVTNSLRLTIRNTGDGRLEAGDLKVITTKQFRPFEAGVKTVEPGGVIVLEGFYSSDDMGKDPWLEIQWTLWRGDREIVCTRMINPRYSAADLALFKSRVRR